MELNIRRLGGQKISKQEHHFFSKRLRNTMGDTEAEIRDAPLVRKSGFWLRYSTDQERPALRIERKAWDWDPPEAGILASTAAGEQRVPP